MARRLAVVVLAAILGSGCGGASRMSHDGQTDRSATDGQFRFVPSDGWHTTSTGLHPPPPQMAAATASTIPIEEPVVGQLPLETLKRLPSTGIVIFVGAGPRPPWGHFTPGSLPPRLAEADVRSAWEGQSNPSAPEYLILRYVNGFNLETRVYFGTQSPSNEQVARAQQELNRLELPLNVEARARLEAHKPSIQAAPRVRWRRSLSRGRPDRGSLVRGVRFPAEGTTFFTWDPILHRSPDRPWRRYGNARLVRIVLRAVARYAHTHPDAPRVGIGDLSRPHGGYFGPKHVSHQNGLDVDVYYPRLDSRERPPTRAAQIDRPLAQNLVDRLVAAGAVRIFVGPNTHLAGPKRIVQVLALHDNHMHVRIAAP